MHLTVHFRSSVSSPLREGCFHQSSVGGLSRVRTLPKAVLFFFWYCQFVLGIG